MEPLYKRPEDLLSDSVVKDWIIRFEKKTTKDNYLQGLLRFCNWLGKTPTQIRDERLADVQNADLLQRGRYEKLVNQWYAQLKMAPRSRGLRYYAVRSFFATVIPLSAGRLMETIKTSRHRVRSAGRITLEQARIMCELAEVRSKALILWETKTGCRPETTAQMTVTDIDRSQGFPWIVYPKRSKSADTGYFTFCDEEAGEALMTYLRWRNLGDDPNLPLFTVIKPESHETLKSPIEPEHISKAIRIVIVAGQRAGRLPTGLRPYGLRKLFQTQLEKARISPNWIKRMMCHGIGDVEEAYSQAELDEMREVYRSAVNAGFLRVFPIQVAGNEQDRELMRTILEAVRVSHPEEFKRMTRTESLSSGDSLMVKVLREMR